MFESWTVYAVGNDQGKKRTYFRPRNCRHFESEQTLTINGSSLAWSCTVRTDTSVKKCLKRERDQGEKEDKWIQFNFGIASNCARSLARPTFIGFAAHARERAKPAFLGGLRFSLFALPTACRSLLSREFNFVERNYYSDVKLPHFQAFILGPFNSLAEPNAWTEEKIGKRCM